MGAARTISPPKTLDDIDGYTYHALRAACRERGIPATGYACMGLFVCVRACVRVVARSSRGGSWLVGWLVGGTHNTIKNHR